MPSCVCVCSQQVVIRDGPHRSQTQRAERAKPHENQPRVKKRSSCRLLQLTRNCCTKKKKPHLVYLFEIEMLPKFFWCSFHLFSKTNVSVRETTETSAFWHFACLRGRFAMPFLRVFSNSRNRVISACRQNTSDTRRHPWTHPDQSERSVTWFRGDWLCWLLCDSSKYARDLCVSPIEYSTPLSRSPIMHTSVNALQWKNSCNRTGCLSSGLICDCGILHYIFLWECSHFKINVWLRVLICSFHNATKTCFHLAALFQLDSQLWQKMPRQVSRCDEAKHVHLNHKVDVDLKKVICMNHDVL